jgi:YD repeat-containing protein
VTRQDFDKNGNLVRQVAFAATIGAADAPQAVAQGAADRVAVSVYDRANRLTHRIDALGGVTEQIYDAAGNVVKRITHGSRVAPPTVDGALPTSAAATPAPNAADRITRAAYDRGGRLIYAVDATGGVTETRYDGAGRVVKTVAYATALTSNEIAGLPAQGTVAALDALMAGKRDGNRDRTTKTYYQPSGLTSYTVDAEGYWTARQLDGAGNLSRTWVFPTKPNKPYPFDETAASNDPWYIGNYLWDPDPATYARTEWFYYDVGGKLYRSVDAVGQSEHYGYDGIGNRTSFTNKNGATWTYRYDAAGRMIEETTPPVDVATVRDEAGSLVLDETATAAVVNRTTYDALGNVTSRTEALGRPEERTTRFGYDALGHQILTVHAAAGVYDAASDDLAVNGVTGLAARVETVQELTTQVVYDSFGDAVACVDVAGNVSYKAYDKLGRVSWEVDALGYVTGHARNVFGEEETLTRYAAPTDLIATSTQPPGATEIEAALAAVDHADDRSIRTEYDRMGRATRVTQPEVWTFNGNDEPNGDLGQLYRKSPVVEHVYDGFGQRVQTRVLVDQTPFTGHPPHFSTNTWATTTHYFDRRGLEVATIDAMGYLTTQTYDAAGNVTKRYERELPVDASWVSKNNGSAYGTTLPVGEDGIPLVGGQGANDRLTTFAYDKLNRKESETRVGVRYSAAADGTFTTGNVITTYGYDAVGNQTRITDALENSTYTFYDALGRTRAVAAPTRSSTADGSSLTPLTVFHRDALGNVVEQVEYARGALSAIDPVAAGADAANDRHTLTRYDALGHAVQTVDALGQSHFLSYDAAGHLAKQWQGVRVHDVRDPDGPGLLRTLAIAFEYDALGRQTAIVTPGSGSEVVRQELIGIETGEVVVVRNIEGVAPDHTGVVLTAMRYNAFGELVGRGNTTVSSDVPYAQASRSYQEYFDYDAAGRLWRTNSGDGVDKVVLSDAMGRQTAVVTSAGSAGGTTGGVDLKALTEPSSTGGVGTWLFGAQTLQLPQGLRGTFTRYDQMGRAVKETQALREDSLGAFRPVVFREFDRWGNVVKQSNPVVQRQGLNLTASWALTATGSPPRTPVPVTTFEYNANGQVVKRIQPTTASLDTHGNTISVVPVTESYYDALGRLVAVKDARGNVNGQQWDGAGQLVAEIHADATPGRTKGVVRRSYDAFGDQVRVTDAEGNGTTYAYDALGRVTSITSDQVIVATVNAQMQVASGVGQLVTRFAYDEVGNRIRETRTSRTPVAYDESGIPIYAGWDTQGNPITNGAEVTTHFAYDLRGNQVAVQQPMGEISRSVHTLQGKEIAAQDAKGSLATWAFDAFGRLTERQDIGGAYYSLHYDQAGQLCRQRSSMAPFAWENDPVWASAFNLLNLLRRRQDLAYGYDSAGQLVQINDGDLDQTTTYAYNAAGQRVLERTVQAGQSHQDQVLSYDDLGRLVRIAGMDGVDVAYDYDEVGNRLRQVTQYNIRRKVPTYGNVQVGTDESGRPIYEQRVVGYHYEYDIPAHTASYWHAYDEMNRQVLVDGAVNGDRDDVANITATQGHRLTYDSNGNRISDKAWGKQVRTYQAAVAWDENGRVTRWETRYEGRDKAVTESYRYDALNRLAAVSTEAFDSNWAPAGTTSLDARVYDASSRVVQSGPTAALPQGYVDALTSGRSNANGVNRRISRYDDNGKLLSMHVTKPDGALDYDLVYEKRVTWSQLEQVQVGTNESGTPIYEMRMVEHSRNDPGYDAAGNVLGYRVAGPSVTSYYDTKVVPRDGYKEAEISGYLSNNTGDVGTTINTYDANGFLVRIDDTKKDANDRTLVNDAQGHVLTKDQDMNLLRQLVANGNVVGVYGVGTDPVKPATDTGDPNYTTQSAFDLNYQPIVNSYGAAATGSYQARTGDTLQSVAQAAYGDATLWYLIADANGLRSNSDLRVGQTLNIPTRVGGAHNTADTFKPYDPSRVVGDTSPYLPVPRARGGCGGLGAILGLILVAVVAVAVTVLTTGLATTVLAGMGPEAAAFFGAIIGAAAGSAASQGLAIGLGLQEDFSWEQVGIAAISAGVTGGLNQASASWGLPTSGASGWAVNVARAAVADAMTQGVANMVGLQDGFDWLSVAAAAARAGIEGPVNDKANDLMNDLLGPAGGSRFGRDVLAATLGGTAGRAVAKLVRNGKVVLEEVAADAFGNALAQGVVEGYREKQRDAEARAKFAASMQMHRDAEDVPPLTNPGERNAAMADGQLGLGANERILNRLRLLAPEESQLSLRPPRTYEVGEEGAQGYWGVAKTMLGPNATDAQIQARVLQLMTANPGKTTLEEGDVLNRGDGSTSRHAWRTYLGMDADYQASRRAPEPPTTPVGWDGSSFGVLLSDANPASPSNASTGAPIEPRGPAIDWRRYYARPLPLGETGIGIGEGRLREAMYWRDEWLSRAGSVVSSPTEKVEAYANVAGWTVAGLFASAVYTIERPAAWLLQGAGAVSEAVGPQTLEQLAGLPMDVQDMGFKALGLAGKYSLAAAAVAKDAAALRAAALAERYAPMLAEGAEGLGRWIKQEPYGAVGDVTALKAALEARRSGPTFYSPYQVHIDPLAGSGPMAIDTTTFTSGERTLAGGIRNPRQFWSQWADTYGETLSTRNQKLIQAGRSPEVDARWIEHFPETKPYLGETLVHHHLDYGRMAIPIPQPVHALQPGWSIWHP